MTATVSVEAAGESPAALALRLVTADPREAWKLAVRARHAARRAGDAAGESVAERALGLAARELSDGGAALRHLRAALRVAQKAGLTHTSAEVRMSLAFVLADAGRPKWALREIDAAAPVLTGLPGARLQMQRALILDRLSRFDEAMSGYTAAIAVLRQAGDRLWQARALTNRGVLHTYRGAIRQAEADLFAAESLYLDLGYELALAQVRHNLGFVAARAGDVPGALRRYDLADEYFARTARPAVVLMDRAELLLHARLLPEARAAAEAALAAARASGMRLFAAQARLMLADAALGGGDLATARAQAGAARRAFVRQGRPAWAALARYTCLRAGEAAGSAAHLRAARSVAADLERAGWTAPALDVRLHIARLLGHGDEAAEELRRVRAAGRRGPAELRARAWHAEATLREGAGDVAGARRALLAGIRVLENHRASLGATELRALASGYATDLATTGLRLALRDGSARSVLCWAERWKAASLRLERVQVPGGEALATDLAELRRVVADRDAAVGESRPYGALLRRQRVLEERIRRGSWRAAGVPPAGPAGLLDRLPAALGARTLVEMFAFGGDLYAVLVAGARYRVRRLCAFDEAATGLRSLRFALRRIVLGTGGAGSRAAALAAASHGAAALDRLLFEPLRPWLGDGDLVLVPAGPLHATPWPLLPTCRGRPLTVAPSATMLLPGTGDPADREGPADRSAQADREGPADRSAPAVDGGAVLVAGPGLAHAPAEVERLAGRLPGARVLTGPAAGVEAVLAALDGARLAHLAAHGEFRADNPMFSQLRLHDGPLTIYDLERLARPPRLVVLSACESALSAVHPGDELLGLCAALLGLGTGTVIGSVLPVDDALVRDLMIEMYRRWSAGTAPEAALAASQESAGGQLDERAVTTGAFVCFGRLS